MCSARFPHLICRPIAAQFMSDDLISLFAIEETDRGLAIVAEKHYRLVPPDQLSPAELASYRKREEITPRD